MAIAPAEIAFRTLGGGRSYRSGVLHDVFDSGTVDAVTDYAWVEVVNTSALTWTSPAAWFSLDAGGAAVAVAVADGTPRDANFSYGAIDPTTLTYSTPVTASSGLALPTLPAGQKCLLCIRRTLTGATPDYPDANTLLVKGSSPL